MELKDRTLQHWQTINAMATRRFGRGPLAEEAALAVIDSLAEGDWRRMRAYSGVASFSAYLRAVTARLLEDFSRRRFGRRRPPLWLQSFGGFWLRLFEALCLERLPSSEAVEVVRQSWPAKPAPQLQEAAREILSRIPDCGMAQGEDRELEEIDGALDDHGVHPAEQRQHQELLRAVSELVLGRTSPLSSDLMRRYQDLRLDLQPQEILLLRLCFQEGLSVAEAGKRLGFNRFQAHGRMRRLLHKIRQELERCGLAEALGFSSDP